MDSGASSYRRYLDGDDDGFVFIFILNEYMDGLHFYLNSLVGYIYCRRPNRGYFCQNYCQKPRFLGKLPFKT